MKNNGGIASLKELYDLVDTSSWGTNTPEATIRKIVQINDVFFKSNPDYRDW